MQHPRHERTYVMVKPDGVRRGLTGEIIRRIEQRGLKIVALKMFKATKEQIHNHYPKDETWTARLGKKTLSTYEKYGYDALKELGTKDELEIGKMVREWLVDYMISAPLVKIVVEGVHAVDAIRKLTGNTQPVLSEMGTIRGDYSVDSAASANRDKRAIYNILHAAETPEEAIHEIGYWMSPEDIAEYKRTDE